MLTNFIAKFSLFTAFITLIYCIAIDVSFGQSIFRSLVVFAGFYVILILFFIIVRILFNPQSHKGIEGE